MPGTRDNPVSLDHFQNIVEVHWRTGDDFWTTFGFIAFGRTTGVPCFPSEGPSAEGETGRYLEEGTVFTPGFDPEKDTRLQAFGDGVDIFGSMEGWPADEEVNEPDPWTFTRPVEISVTQFGSLSVRAKLLAPRLSGDTACKLVPGALAPTLVSEKLGTTGEVVVMNKTFLSVKFTQNETGKIFRPAEILQIFSIPNNPTEMTARVLFRETQE